MFIDNTKFKKAVKAAYSGFGLRIEHFEGGFLSINGNAFILEIDEADLTKKCKAAIIELTGEIPEEGTGYIYRKGEEKEEVEIEQETEGNMMGMYANGTEAEDTRLMLQRHSTCYSILQTVGKREPHMIRRDIQTMVDGTKVDEDAGELPPGNPRVTGSLIIWNNDTMQLATVDVPVHNTGEREFLRLINAKNMTWDFED